MKVQVLLLAFSPLVMAFSSSTSTSMSRKAFVARQTTLTQLMDTEGDAIDFASRQKLEAFLDQLGGAKPSLEEAKHPHGMPWTRSIDEELGEGALLYMPFWEWQMEFMEDSLTNLRVQSCVSEEDETTDYTYNENKQKKARIVNACFASDEYRKIRLTYYDAGDKTQVFNSLWYPNPKYNLPVLGIDLLAFNRKKYLAIVDFQPLHEDEGDHAATFEDRLAPIKKKYDSLKGQMSSKFYDETQFFSQQMLFARFEEEAVVHDELLPAFREYVEAHLKLVRETTPEPADMQLVMERQQEYDTYSAERDPATGFFAAMFGKDWADGFVHDFLFSLSERVEADAADASSSQSEGSSRKVAASRPEAQRA